jgi:hypothetical protein
MSSIASERLSRLRSDGMVNEFIGDTVLAFFGAPHAQADHADRAVSAALAIDEFAQRFSAGQRANGVDFGQTRIGVHTGTAMASNIGTRERLKYGAQGDMLNAGARLDGLNKTIGTRILVSGDKCGKHDGTVSVRSEPSWSKVDMAQPRCSSRLIRELEMPLGLTDTGRHLARSRRANQKLQNSSRLCIGKSKTTPASLFTAAVSQPAIRAPLSL